MAERLLKLDMSNALTCDTCRTEPVANECSDAWELPDGKWEERGPRRGCLNHPVVPMVHFADGRQISFEEYRNGNS
jgi:hypothetical protein